jgi:hypothetical protein
MVQSLNKPKLKEKEYEIKILENFRGIEKNRSQFNSASSNGHTTFSITTLSIMTFSIMKMNVTH